MRVLVAEDQVKLAETVAVGLRREGMAVDIALDGQQALDRAVVTSYDVIVLDRDLPAVHGDEVCHQLIARGVRKPDPHADRGGHDRGPG
jgi:DNA-binding response OmpR family regulator